MYRSDDSINGYEGALDCLKTIYSRSSFTGSSTGSFIPTPSSSSWSSFSSCRALYFLFAFLLLLAFFLLLIPAFNATLLSGPFSASSIFSAIIRLAILRFCDRDRVACDFMTVPVGMCLSWTADEVLFCSGMGSLAVAFASKTIIQLC